MRILKNKRALVTGAASGIGRAISLELARHGVHLILADRNQVGLARTASEVGPHGVECVTFHYDAEVGEQVANLAKFAGSVGDGIDILVNNAGVTYHGPTDRMRMDHWQRLMEINVMAPVRLTQALFPTFIERPEVHILNVCSALGLVGLPKVCAYSTTKFALVGFSESLRAEFGKQGIGVTALCPGLVKTNLFASSINDVAAKKKVPPDWVCTSPEQVARAAVRAIRKNQGVVVVEPIARMLTTVKRFAPWLIDWGLHIGKRRHTRRRLIHARRLKQQQHRVEEIAERAVA
jgi:short-subunit dehydrogenase